jgi:hypothetical protein
MEEVWKTRSETAPWFLEACCLNRVAEASAKYANKLNGKTDIAVRIRMAPMRCHLIVEVVPRFGIPSKTGNY